MKEPSSRGRGFWSARLKLPDDEQYRGLWLDLHADRLRIVQNWASLLD